VTLGVGEHFFTFRHEVKAQLLAQLKALEQAQVIKLETLAVADQVEEVSLLTGG